MVDPGPLKSSRLAAHLDRLLNSLGADFGLENNTLRGQDARTPDPFSAPRGVMGGPCAHRVTSLIHWDLNPRNILGINKTTRAGIAGISSAPSGLILKNIWKRWPSWPGPLAGLI